jgi:hypothetical protein
MLEGVGKWNLLGIRYVEPCWRGGEMELVRDKVCRAMLEGVGK